MPWKTAATLIAAAPFATLCFALPGRLFETHRAAKALELAISGAEIDDEDAKNALALLASPSRRIEAGSREWAAWSAFYRATKARRAP
ncbi:hypothetical protein WOC76_20185 [Methylocystis sp. IM3]|uniref:hypothetical protein n=1 Tax=unclassified Methylocystis TaxID=2625913 RepID=UPI0030FAC739